MAGILVIPEAAGNDIASSSLEAVRLASALATPKGLEVSALLLGDNLASGAEQLHRWGVHKVYLAEDPRIGEPSVEAYVAVLGRVLQQASPRLVLGAHALLTGELFPLMAARLRTGVLLKCSRIGLSDDGQGVEAATAVFGGAAETTYDVGPREPVFVTMQAGMAVPDMPGPADQGPVQVLRVPVPEFKENVQRVRRDTVSGPRLEESEVIVAGGRGLSDREHYRLIEELAAALGGQAGATRPLVDDGWVDPSRQIGLTGKYVSPGLYVAVGISGASQHMAGLSGAKTIVAINTDSDAFIFRYARYGVIADALEFLPVFTEKVRRLLDRKT